MSEKKSTIDAKDTSPQKKGGCLQGCLTIIVIIVIFGAIIGACFGGENEEIVEETAPTEKEDTQLTDENELIAYAQNITGRTFVKNISLVDNFSVIDFYSDFEDFKTDNPTTNLTEETYKEYFETGDAIEKILVIENIRLLREFPSLSGAKMNLPFEGKTYSISMDRDSINSYLGFKVEDLKVEDDTWVTQFVNPIGYDKNKRKEIMQKFGTIQ